MEIYNALDIKAGKKVKRNTLGSVTQPVQFLNREEKDEAWKALNLDWLEWEGLKQLRRNSRGLLKNYKLAAGIIDRTDYIVEEENEYADLTSALSDTGPPEALELKFYPIIPNVIDVLEAEFAKRNKRVSFRAMDEYTYNEIVAQKTSEIENILIQHAESKVIEKMIAAGADPEDPAFKQQLAQQTSPDILRQLPEIDRFYSKDYQTLGEQWASKQHNIDEERFKMDELEEEAFRDSLISDREFWHFKLGEDDYDIELWNPVLTFYHKSPDVRYISEGNWVGKIDMMTVADVIDRYGAQMTEEQLQSLEQLYPVTAAGYTVGGYQNDGAYYDGTKSHAYNTNQPSLQYRQTVSALENFTANGGDIVDWILGQSEDFLDFGSAYFIRVTTAYWKSQRRVGHLTKIHESGEVTTAIVDESYKVTTDPIYDTTLIQNKDATTLVYGEHIEWIWINQTWGGVKIGPNFPSFWGNQNPSGFDAIYLGIGQKDIGPLKFQLKGDQNLYKCKLPVEGRVFTDRNTKSIAPVDRMKPFQIGYNLVNNQIADILIDEIGSVLVIDQNTIPRHSMGEDWGKHNFAKTYQIMKDFGIAPLDTSITNTENALNFNQFQKVELEQTNRLVSRIQLANYFKSQCFENIGVVPQRMGQQLGQTNTATGVEQALTGSYAQTEKLFTRHSDHLMPRVHQMRTDIAQYYHSNKSSVRLRLVNSLDERVNFEINGTDLLLRDINVYCSAKANHRDVLQKLQNLALEDNTMGAGLSDIGSVLQADSIGSLNSILGEIDHKAQQRAEAERAHAEKLQQMTLEAKAKEEQIAADREERLQEMKNRTAVLVAEIRAAGFGSMQDINQNQQSDFIDAMDKIQQTRQYQDAVDVQKEQNVINQNQFAQKINLEKQEMAHEQRLKDKDIQIAKENKNQYDTKSSKKDEKS